MNSPELTPQQNQFLTLLRKNVGMIDKTLEQLGLDRVIFFDWRKNELFDQKHRLTMAEITNHMEAQNALLAKRRRAEILLNGTVEETHTVETKMNGKGQITTTSKKTVKKSSPPPSMLSEREMAVVEALTVLVRENILPIEQARMAVSKGRAIQAELLEIFTANNNEDQRLEDEKVMALIKQAVLGNG